MAHRLRLDVGMKNEEKPPAVGDLPPSGNGHGASAFDVRGVASAPEAAAARSDRLRRWLPLGVLALAALLLVALLAPRLVSSLRSPAPAGLLFASGRIEGRITTLTPKSSARVTTLHIDEGQPVRAGDLLATLDDRAQRERVNAAQQYLDVLVERLRAADTELAMTERQVSLQIEQAEAALREADARLQRARTSELQARRDAQRAAILVAKELIAAQVAEHARLQADLEVEAVREAEEALARTRKQLEQARLGPQQVAARRAERDALERQRRQAQAQLAEQASVVTDFAIRSPIAGRVLTRTIEVGERVEAGTPLFTLVDLDRLYVKIYVPEPSIGKVALGQEARVYVDAHPGRPFAARVSKVAQEAEFTPKNVETREERVKLVFAVEVALAENPGGVLKPGMPADAVIRWQPDAAWVTPADASRRGVLRREGATRPPGETR
ncbi:MAG TPA: efflux RND transporter periplasmic adaptor subunit [Methylomirabilota bacterium]|nr:efflux RND transporter periplasmic adaptor subunit [Methylomirabilota bacterium]